MAFSSVTSTDQIKHGMSATMLLNASCQSVLDALRMARRDLDPTLAFRFACINANACKECMMLIDGEVEYACKAKLREGETALAPLPKKALLRDLATEIAPPEERLFRPTKS